MRDWGAESTPGFCLCNMRSAHDQPARFCWHQESPKDRQNAVVRQPRSARASPASVASPLFASSAVPLLAPRGPRRVTRRRTVWRIPAPHGASENVRNRTTNHERARAIPPHKRLATPTCCIARAGDSRFWGLVSSSTPTVARNVHDGTGPLHELCGLYWRLAPPHVSQPAADSRQDGVRW